MVDDTRKSRPADGPQATEIVGLQTFPDGGGKSTVPAAILLVVMAFAAFAPCLGNAFIWDDDDYVYENPTLTSLDGLRRIWFEIDATPQYYPLVHTTYWLEHQFWGLEPAGYHAVNILLHAIAAILLWRLLRRLGVPGAWLAAAIFAVHPVTVESVAWITERKNVLSLVFYLASACVYLRGALPSASGAGPARPRLLYALALALFVCALLSKTVTCTLPAALLLILWWKRGRVTRGDWLKLAPFFVLGVCFGLLTAWLEKHQVGAAGEEWTLTLVERCLVAGRAIWFYVDKIIWPENLTFVYPRWEIDGAVWWQYAYPLTVIVAAALLWLARGRIGRGPLVAALVFCGTLLPALGFFDVYPMRFSYVADHFQYHACPALITLGAAAFLHGLARLGPVAAKAAVPVSLAGLAVLGTLTIMRCPAYADAETLWRDTIERNDGAWLAHYNLGVILNERDDLDEAAMHLRKVMRLNPKHHRAHNHMAVLLQKKGLTDEAIAECREAIRLLPTYAKAHNNLGVMLHGKGLLEDAVRHYRKAIEYTPESETSHLENAKTHNNLGMALQNLGRSTEAAASFEAAARLDPAFAETLCNLGIVLMSLGKRAEAAAQFEAALRIDPNHEKARRFLERLRRGGR